MKYFVLLAGDGGTKPWDSMSEDEQRADMGKHMAFAEACAARDGVEMLGGEALDPAATTTMRTSLAGEVVLTDGPFVEAAEHIGGYYVISAPDLAVLVELLKVLPPYDIDIRPIVDIPGTTG